MRYKKESNLWLMFAINIFFGLILMFIVVAVIAFILWHTGLLNEGNYNPFGPLMFFIGISVVLALILTLSVGRRILVPVTAINIATKKVANGDFSVRIKSDSKITAIKEMSDNFDAMIQELSHKETLTNDFLVNVSHEFKTPLSTIEGYVQLLQDPLLLEKERNEYTKFIMDSTQQLSKLVHNILNLSKLENQEMVIDKKDFRLDEQIRECILLLESKWGEKNISIDIDLPHLSYYGSENLLHQVWVNLLDNAIKFSEPNSIISIAAIQENNSLSIAIKDSGKGMTKDQVHHIFDKFYQVDNNRDNQGNGLGLSIVKRIIDLHKAHIEVESYPDTGSIFTVIFTA